MVFENEDFGIILEDDCSPNKYFFSFCQKMLIEHMQNNKVFSISGSNFICNEINIKEDFFIQSMLTVGAGPLGKELGKYMMEILLV